MAAPTQKFILQPSEGSFRSLRCFQTTSNPGAADTGADVCRRNPSLGAHAANRDVLRRSPTLRAKVLAIVPSPRRAPDRRPEPALPPGRVRQKTAEARSCWGCWSSTAGTSQRSAVRGRGVGRGIGERVGGLRSFLNLHQPVGRPARRAGLWGAIATRPMRQLADRI